jgi:hypothetical protein
VTRHPWSRPCPSDVPAARRPRTVTDSRRGAVRGDRARRQLHPDAAVTGAASPASAPSAWSTRARTGPGTTVVAARAARRREPRRRRREGDHAVGGRGATTVASGDILAWSSVHVGGTGLVDPGGLVAGRDHPVVNAVGRAARGRPTAPNRPTSRDFVWSAAPALAGDPVARAALTANWAHFLMVDAIVEVDDCLTDGCGPFGPQTN